MLSKTSPSCDVHITTVATVCKMGARSVTSRYVDITTNLLRSSDLTSLPIYVSSVTAAGSPHTDEKVSTMPSGRCASVHVNHTAMALATGARPHLEHACYTLKAGIGGSNHKRPTGSLRTIPGL